MRTVLSDAARGILWYVKEMTGESKWDEYLARCRTEAREPMPRRDFERHRADHKENSTTSRCC